MAAGVALGLATLLSAFAVLMAWAVQLSTDAAYNERLVMVRTTARAVDDLMGQALHQIGALTGEIAWDAQHLQPLAEQPLLERLVHVSGTFESLGITDRQGRLLWSWGPPEDVAVLPTSPIGAAAITSSEPAVGAAPLKNQHPPIAVAATALRNRQGDIVGALVGTLHLAHMGVELVPMPLGRPDLHVQLVDSEGRVLRSSSSGDSGDIPGLARQHLALLSASLQKGEAAAVLEEGEGEAHLVAFAPFQKLSGGVFTEERADMALMVPRQLQRIGVFVGSAALLLVSLGAWWYARRITRPLEDLTAASQTIASGSFDHPVSVNSDDELGVLARSFDEMRVRLNAAFADRLRWEEELERQVRERTETVHQLLEKVISAQEEERKRIARELHDGVAQDMAALIVAIDSLQVDASISATRRDLMQRVKGQAQEALQEVRRLLLDLRPSALDDLGLVPAVRWYVETRLAGEGIEHTVTVTGPERRLSPTLETTLFRIVQEAVNNAAKHAEPHKVGVQLDFTEPTLVALIEDDGKGFDSLAYRHGQSGEAMGLAGMQERATLADGTLEVHSEPGHGTQIVARIPIMEEAIVPHQTINSG